MATMIFVNIGSGNGLLPDGTKPLPEPMLTKLLCLWHSHKRNLTELAQSITWVNNTFRIIATYASGQWVLWMLIFSQWKCFTLSSASLQNKCQTADPDPQNLCRSSKLSFFNSSYMNFGKIVLRSCKFLSYFEDWSAASLSLWWERWLNFMLK